MNANRKTSVNKNTPPRLRRSALATASVLALGGFLGTSALAQSTTYNVTYATGVQAPVILPGPPNMTDWILNWQNNAGAVFAGATAVSMGVDHIAVLPPPLALPIVGTPATVSNNTSTPTARGNNAPGNTVDLAQLGNGVGGAGIIILSGQSNITGPVQSSVNNVNAHIREVLHPAAAMVVNNNTLSATTQVNNADNSAYGLVPGTLSPAVVGGITTTTANATNSTTAGNVNIVNHQNALATLAGAGPLSVPGVGSIASTSAATVTLDLERTTNVAGGVATEGSFATPGLLSSPLTVDGNAITAAYGANQTTNVFNAQTGAGASAYKGSVVMSNSQFNQGTVLAPVLDNTAVVTGSGVLADIRNSFAGQTDLTATLDVSSNTVSATSSGNKAGALASNGTWTDGNQILFNSGANLTGASSVANNTLGAGPTETATLGADLALSSVQANKTTALRSTVTTGTVKVRGDRLAATGVITDSSNTVAATAQGNLAGNRVQVSAFDAGGNALTLGEFNANVAAANLQTNTDTRIAATNTSPEVSVNVGIAGGGAAAVVVEGMITANSNALTAKAQGSVAETLAVVNAANITGVRGGGLAGGVAADATTTGVAAAVGGATGVSANNLQGNYAPTAPINATVTSASVAANIVTQTDGLGTPVPLSAAKITLNDNAIQAYAGGNDAATTVALAAANTAAAQAAVGNAQFHESPITAAVSGATGVNVVAGNATNGTAVTINGNTVDATILVNKAANSLSVAGANITAGPNPFAAATSNARTVTTLAGSNAAFGVASSQNNVAANNASTQTSTAFAAANLRSIIDSTVTTNGNAATANTTANQANNRLTVAAGNVLDTSVNAASAIGGLANRQSNTGAASAVAGDSNAYVAPLFGVVAYGNGPAPSGVVTRSTLTVNQNTIATTALGNVAGNATSVTGASLDSAATAFATGTILGTALTNEFALINHQTDDAVTRSATAGNGAFIGFAGGDFTVLPAVTLAGITDVELAVNKNVVIAEARNNNATNSQSLVFGSTLNSGASLLNLQSASTAVTTVAAPWIGDWAKNSVTLRSNLTVNDNVITALSVGSSAASTQTVDAPTLRGNANIAAGAAVNNGSSVTGITADYALANNQSQTGALTSTVTPSFGPNHAAAALGDVSSLTDSTATVNGNATQAISQGTSATNKQNLAAGNGIAGVSGAVGSVQSTNAAVAANQVGSRAIFMVSVLNAVNSPVTVSGNNGAAAAGQNEAINTQNVASANITGAGGGTGASTGNSAVPSGSSGTDFSVVNLQSGAGSVAATSTDGGLGVDILRFSNNSLTVSDNAWTSKAIFNRAVNTQVFSAGLDANGNPLRDAAGNLVAAANVAATGAIVNSQNTAAGATGNALVGTVQVGTAVADGFWHGTGELTNALTTVSGNDLLAFADGNVAGNSFSVASANVAGSADVTGVKRTFAVQNYQTNAAAMTAAVQKATVGVFVTSDVGGGIANTITTSKVTVSGNALEARSNANTASNALDVSASNAITAGAGAPTFTVLNTQANTAATSATVGGTAANAVSVGIAAGVLITGSNATVSGNNLTAQVGGNTANNTLSVTAGNSIAPLNQPTPVNSLAVVNTQDNTGAGPAAATVQNATVGVLNTAGFNTTNATVQGNQVLASGYGNSATNAVTLSALAGNASQATASISNRQNNTQAITALASGVNVGIGAGPANGGSSVVTGNSVSAQATGNYATNRIGSR